MFGVCLPGGQCVRITLLYLGKSEPLPVAEGHFAQTWLWLDGEMQRGGNDAGCVPGSLQIAAVQRMHPFSSQSTPQSLCLALASGAQG